MSQLGHWTGDKNNNKFPLSDYEGCGNVLRYIVKSDRFKGHKDLPCKSNKNSFEYHLPLVISDVVTLN